MTLVDWIVVMVLALVLLYCLYQFGSYEQTGARGVPQRIWAGFRLVMDVAAVRLSWWLAKQRRRR